METHSPADALLAAESGDGPETSLTLCALVAIGKTPSGHGKPQVSWT